MNEPKSNQALNKALSLLSKRSYSKGILRQKLEEKEFPQEEINIAIKKLEQMGFIDDEKYAESIVREYSTLKRYGAYRVKLKLKEKLVPDDIVVRVLNLISSESEEINLAELAKKQVKKNQHLSKERIISRTLGYLIRRGYSYDKSRKAIENALNT